MTSNIPPQGCAQFERYPLIRQRQWPVPHHFQTAAVSAAKPTMAAKRRKALPLQTKNVRQSLRRPNLRQGLFFLAPLVDIFVL